MSILERLEQMEKRMAEIAAAGVPGQGPEAPPIQVLLAETMVSREDTGSPRGWFWACQPSLFLLSPCLGSLTA